MSRLGWPGSGAAEGEERGNQTLKRPLPYYYCYHTTYHGNLQGILYFLHNTYGTTLSAHELGARQEKKKLKSSSASIIINAKVET